MILRTAAAAVGLPLLILVTWAGSPWFAMLVAIAAAIGALELRNMASRRGERPLALPAMALAAALIVLAHLLAGRPFAETYVAPIVAVGAAGSLVWLLWAPKGETMTAGWAMTAGCALYIGGLLFHAPLLRELDTGREWMLILLLVTFAADTSAFAVGRAIGRHPLVPSISPSKTLEGAAGGVAGAVGGSFGAVYMFDVGAGVWVALAIGVLMGSVGQLGDLAVSQMKRIAGVKDSGWLVPGHGGVLDRMDSIVFNLVVVYYLALWGV